MVPSDAHPGTLPVSPGERELLDAVSRFVLADRGMRRALAQRMAMGETDLRAIRFVMAAGRLGETVTPHGLARHLGISSAATTVVLDRLGEAGHLERVPHPSDRRSKVVVATPHAYEESRHHLAVAHDRMREVAARVEPSSRPAVIDFLDALAEIMRDEVDTP